MKIGRAPTTSFKSIFTVDLRSLAFMRQGIALTLIVDLILRFSDLEAHYTDSGILPLEALFRESWNRYFISVYTMASSWPLQAVIFLINFACVCCLLVGYRTRLFSIICWIFLLSLQNRNPLILQAGDDLLRMTLFWGIFLPWGYYYSVDSLQMQAPDKPKQYTSLAGFAYILQVFYLYFFTAVLKSSPEWTSEFTALYYALSLDQILLPFGKLIYPYESLLKVLTAATYYTELILPFVLFIPFFHSFFRILFFTVFTMLHIGIYLSLNVGLFPMICIASMLGLLPFLAIQKVHDALKMIRVHVRDFFKRLLFIFNNKAFYFKNQGVSVPNESLLKKFVVAFFMLYVLIWNVHTTGRLKIFTKEYHWVGHLFKVTQFWGMFAPSVFKDDGWFVFVGKTAEGKEVDLNNHGSDVSFEKPYYVAGTYKNDRWRKYSENILFVSNSHFRLYYCHYLINNWNKNVPEGEEVKKLDVYYMKAVSLPDYKEEGPSKELLCYCSIE